GMQPEPSVPAALLDPQRERALLDHLRLARAPGVGPRTARLLREHLGPVGVVLASPAERLIELGVPARLARALHDPGLWRAAQQELAHLRAKGDDLLGLELPGYPTALAEIHDPPQVLSVRGRVEERDALAVAIVGARRAT